MHQLTEIISECVVCVHRTVETIIESEKKAEPETHILKSDGTTTKIRPKKARETNAVRQLTSQEESILMPLIQGLLTANGCDSPLMQTKHENTPFADADADSVNNNGNGDKVENELSKIFNFMFTFYTFFLLEMTEYWAFFL